MQINSNHDVLSKVNFLTGNAEFIEKISDINAKVPFENSIIEFLNDVSRELMSNKNAKAYSDVITFAFWIRKSSLLKLKERFEKKDGAFHIGKGVAFHIAPSNVPVNFAYSLTAGLLNGNANIVRVPSKNFEQIALISEAFEKVLEKERYQEFKSYVLLVRYERDKNINDLFSSVADVRVIWGGDNTIEELRKSPLPPRSTEITFADRYSIAFIDSDSYLEIENKIRVAEDFYNDTFFSDQNACTSPRIIIWTGNKISEAKKIFWEEEHKTAIKKYNFQPIQGVNKLTQSCLIAVAEHGVKVENHQDNLIIRVSVPEIKNNLMDYRDNSGYFYEYECDDILKIKNLCNDKRCQTVAYIGDKKIFLPLIQSGIKGIDRIVPVGRTMDFDLIWDGYDLSSSLSRNIVLA